MALQEIQKDDKAFDFGSEKNGAATALKPQKVATRVPKRKELAPKTMLLKLSLIKRESQLQFRKKMNDDAVRDYRVVARKSGRFDRDPIVFEDDDGNYWLGDGWHRLLAFDLEGITKIHVEVRRGSKLDAMTFAAGANAANGLRPTNEDKRFAIKKVITDPEFGTLGNNAIAEICKVSPQLVKEVRTELIAKGEISKATHRVGRDNKSHPVVKSKQSRKKRDTAKQSPAPNADPVSTTPAAAKTIPTGDATPTPAPTPATASAASVPDLVTNEATPAQAPAPAPAPTPSTAPASTAAPAQTTDAEPASSQPSAESAPGRDDAAAADPAGIFRKRTFTDPTGNTLELWLTVDGTVGMLAPAKMFTADSSLLKVIADTLTEFGGAIAADRPTATNP